jgi:excisionase family DNA binding protein
VPTIETRKLRFEDLPEVCTPWHLWHFLPIGRDAVYAALNAQKIRNTRLGQKFLIPKAAVRDFLGGEVE